LLIAVFFVPDRNGITDIFDPHLVDGNLSVVFLALNVNHNKD
jgi:hypothetical protein